MVLFSLKEKLKNRNEGFKLQNQGFKLKFHKSRFVLVNKII
jgi:hypothetical protein